MSQPTDTTEPERAGRVVVGDEIPPVDMGQLRNLSVLVGKALRQRVTASDMKLNPSGQLYLPLTQEELDANPDISDEEKFLPYWLQDVAVGEFGGMGVGAAIRDAYGRTFEVRVVELGTPHPASVSVEDDVAEEQPAE